MTAGSGAKVLTAWADPATQRAVLAEAGFTERTLAEVRRRGWAQSVAEREAGRRLGLRAGARPDRRGHRRGLGVRSGGADRPAAGRPLGRRPGRGRRRADRGVVSRSQTHNPERHDVAGRPVICASVAPKGFEPSLPP